MEDDHRSQEWVNDADCTSTETFWFGDINTGNLLSLFLDNNRDAVYFLRGHPSFQRRTKIYFGGKTEGSGIRNKVSLSLSFSLSFQKISRKWILNDPSENRRSISNELAKLRAWLKLRLFKFTLTVSSSYLFESIVDASIKPVSFEFVI